MKPLFNNCTTKQARIFTALILTGILSVSSGLTVLKSATAAPINLLSLNKNEVLKENIKTNRLPRSVAYAVLQDLSSREQIPLRKLEIIDYSQQNWRNGCLNLPKPNELCTQAFVSGWRVVLSDGSQKWIYHTNNNGRSLRLANSNTPTSNQPELPNSVKNAVLQAASQFTGLATSQFRVVNFEQIVTDGCLSLPRPREACTEIALKAWKVTVVSSKHRLVFHARPNGREVRLNEAASRSGTPSANLPKDIAEKILADASNESGLPISRLQIVELEQRQWPDSCLGISNPRALCAAVIVPGWQVTVSDGEQRWVYRAGESGVIAFDEKASVITHNNTLKPVPIPINQLPPPIERGVIFRQITSGGFTGRTYQTVLLDDGRLIRVRIGDANDSERSVRRINLQQVRSFQQLLEEEGFGEFQNLSYPAPRGSADYITYTLTSSDGTVQYNDISQNSLPKNLRALINTWNQISRS